MNLCRSVVLAVCFAFGSRAHALPEAHWVWPSAFASYTYDAADVYVLQAEINGDKTIRRGPLPHSWAVRSLHLVFRSDQTPRVEALVPEFLALAKRWNGFGVRVRGLQVDYDSPSSKLKEYVQVLEKLRATLPSQFSLSVTGLADWSHFGNPRTLPFANKSIEVAFQMYGRVAHPEVRRYIQSLRNLNFPFRVGLLPGQNLVQADQALLVANPYYQGIIRFHGRREEK